MRCYVIEIAGDCNIVAHQTSGEFNQLRLARDLARGNGRAAVLAGEVQYFWADVNEDGHLEVGAFDEELCPED